MLGAATLCQGRESTALLIRSCLPIGIPRIPQLAEEAEGWGVFPFARALTSAAGILLPWLPKRWVGFFHALTAQPKPTKSSPTCRGGRAGKGWSSNP